MTSLRRSIIALSGAAFLLFANSGIINAQTPPEDRAVQEDATRNVTRDDDFDWGWLGLLGLIGLFGLTGARDRSVRTDRRVP